MATFFELKVSEEISASTAVSDTYTPPDGEVVNIFFFQGEGAYSQNSVCKLEFDTDVLWSIKGGGNMPFEIDVTGDGTKKLKVTCDNGESGSIVMSSYARYTKQ